MVDQLTLTVGGRIYSGWESVEITRSVQAVAGGFQLAVTDRWAGQAMPWPIRCGDACVLAIDGETVINGYVDQVVPSFSGSQRGIRVKGRDRTGDLVDCSAMHSPGEWAGIGLKRLAAILCQPFGVSVSAEVDVGKPFAKFALQPGETAWEALERACRLRAVLATGDGDGGVLITRAGQQRARDDLVQGENILAGNATLDMTRRYSRYAVDAQNIGSDNAWGAAAAEIRGAATDAGVPRYRPLLVLAEGSADTATARQRAQWEATVRAARGAEARITVQGWSQQGGALWRPNQRVQVASDWLRIHGEMLIAAVTYRKDDTAGTTAELQLMRPDALTPSPEVPKAIPSSSSGSSGSGANFNDWIGEGES